MGKMPAEISQEEGREGEGEKHVEEENGARQTWAESTHPPSAYRRTASLASEAAVGCAGGHTSATIRSQSWPAGPGHRFSTTQTVRRRGRERQRRRQSSRATTDLNASLDNLDIVSMPGDKATKNRLDEQVVGPRRDLSPPPPQHGCP